MSVFQIVIPFIYAVIGGIGFALAILAVFAFNRANAKQKRSGALILFLCAVVVIVASGILSETWIVPVAGSMAFLVTFVGYPIVRRIRRKRAGTN